MIHACHDMMVDPALAARAAADETGENVPVVVPGTYVGNTNLDGRMSGTILTGKKWDRGRTINVALQSGVHPDVRRKVQERFEQAFSYVSMDLRFVPSWESGDLRVGFVRGDGSWSYLGTDNRTIAKSQRTMNYGWLEPDSPASEFERVVVHEVFHAFGMPHEHQHPKNGIPWDKPAVYRYYQGPPNNWTKAQVDHNLFEKYSETVTQFSEFDRLSIMLYPIPNELTLGDWYAPRNTTPSKTDVAFLADQYGTKVAPPPPPSAGIAVASYAALGKMAPPVDKPYEVKRAVKGRPETLGFIYPEKR